MFFFCESPSLSNWAYLKYQVFFYLGVYVTALEQEDQVTNPRCKAEVRKQKIKLDRKNWPLLEMPNIFPMSMFGGSALTLMLVVLSVAGCSFSLVRVHDDLDEAKNNLQLLNSLLSNMSEANIVVLQKVNMKSIFLEFIVFTFWKIKRNSTIF